MWTKDAWKHTKTCARCADIGVRAPAIGFIWRGQMYLAVCGACALWHARQGEARPKVRAVGLGYG